MSTRPLVEPALLPLIDALPASEFSDAALPAIRQAFLAMEPEPAPLPMGVEVKEIAIPGLDGEPEVRALHYTPPGPARGTLVHFHGGGLVLGRPEQMRAAHGELAAQMGLEVVAPAYRLAPEHAAPAALRDGLAAVLWAQRLNPKLIIGGDSAAAVSKSA